jgi:hypothetical protein
VVCVAQAVAASRIIPGLPSVIIPRLAKAKRAANDGNLGLRDGRGCWGEASALGSEVVAD